MSKQLKVIECPKCGSTQNTEVRPGYYRCKDCNTAYFLDDDDINYNITNDNPQPGAKFQI